MRLHNIGGKSWAILLGVCLSATSVFASSYSVGDRNAPKDEIQLGVPSFGGNGCPSGTASVSLSPDAKSLSVLYDQYLAEAGGSTRKSFDRKSCNVAIPVHVPQGLSVSVIQIDYRGFNSLPRGARSEFNVEYFFAGYRGPRYTKRFSGPYDDGEYLISNALEATALVWSACGDDVILRSNSSLLVRTNRQKDQVLSTVDSMDLNAGIVYQLQWKKCY